MSRGLATGLIAGAITVVLVVAATGFALFAGVSHGKYATIAHPCSLVDASAVSAIVPHAQTDEHGGPSAECKIAADGVATKLDAGLPV